MHIIIIAKRKEDVKLYTTGRIWEGYFHSTYIKQDSFVIIPPKYGCWVVASKENFTKSVYNT